MCRSRYEAELTVHYGIYVSQMSAGMLLCRNHYPVISSYMTYYRVCKKSNMTDVTGETGCAYLSGTSELTAVFSGLYVEFSV
jgi:hypothetical protein